MITNRSVPTDVVLPHIVYKDVAEASVWLSRVFGFREHFRYGDPSAPNGAQMKLEKAWIMIYKTREGSGTPMEVKAMTQSVTVFVEDVDAHYERAKAAGARIVEELHVTEYGERQYGVEDLAGHHWLFSLHARDMSPKEWGATVRDATLVRPYASMAPMLSVRRGSQAVEFYKAAFGAEVLFLLDNEGSVVAELAVCESRFWVADESPEHLNFSPETLGGGTTRMMLVVENPDASFERAVGAGAKVEQSVENHSYGWRVGRVVDPFGHHWEIGKPLARNK